MIVSIINHIKEPIKNGFWVLAEDTFEPIKYYKTSIPRKPREEQLEIIKWCKEKFGDPKNKRWFIAGDLNVFCFQSQEDLTLFSLRWL